MRKLHLENRSINYESLSDYGFIKQNESYTFEKLINNNEFKVVITINKKEQLSKLIDPSTGEEYILVDTDSVGPFVGKVRNEYENVINNFINSCTSSNIFKSSIAKKIIAYVKDTYDSDLEYLWDKFPDFAVIRNKKSNKWYCLLAKINESNLGIDSSNVIEVINLKYQRDKVNEVIDNISIFPGYHMNKRSWISIRLDKIDFDRIKDLIDNSYNLS